MLASGKRYYQFVREERLFCAALAHLLMQKGSNLTTFLQLVNAKSPADSQLPLTRIDEAEVYVEFAFLRDYWHGLARDNDAKRRFIFDLFSRVDRLRHYESDSFPSVIGEFNGTFMGSPGTRIRNDIVYPGRWSVTGLFERFGARPDEFRDFCRFKWSFNIKPDVVVLLPGSKPLCVEAKFESKEGRYPTSSSDCVAFDAADAFERVGRAAPMVDNAGRLLPVTIVTGLRVGGDRHVACRQPNLLAPAQPFDRLHKNQRGQKHQAQNADEYLFGT